MSQGDSCHDDPPGAWRLTAIDAQGVDAVVEGGYRTPGASDERATRAAGVFALLDAGLGGHVGDARARLVERSMALLDAAGATGRVRSSEGETAPRLIPDDEEAVDALVLAEHRLSRVPGALRARAAQAERLGDLLTAGSAASPSDRARLVEATMSRLDAGVTIPIERARVPARSTRLADVLSIAAMIAIASAVLWPMVSGVRTQGMLGACQDHLSKVAAALGGYAGDYRDQLPVATAGLPAGPWWDVGTTPQRSNSANLYRLVRAGYARVGDLACAGNPGAAVVCRDPNAEDWGNLGEVSYSYRIMFGPSRVGWRDPSGVVVVSDRSPVVLRAVKGETIYPFENSPNHAGRGQQALFADGSARWLSTPVSVRRGGAADNIWLPRGHEAALAEVQRQLRAQGATEAIVWLPPIRGNELPQGTDDDFVGP